MQQIQAHRENTCPGSPAATADPMCCPILGADIVELRGRQARGQLASCLLPTPGWTQMLRILQPRYRHRSGAGRQDGWEQDAHISRSMQCSAHAPHPHAAELEVVNLPVPILIHLSDDLLDLVILRGRRRATAVSGHGQAVWAQLQRGRAYAAGRRLSHFDPQVAERCLELRV